MLKIGQKIQFWVCDKYGREIDRLIGKVVEQGREGSGEYTVRAVNTLIYKGQHRIKLMVKAEYYETTTL